MTFESNKHRVDLNLYSKLLLSITSRLDNISNNSVYLSITSSSKHNISDADSQSLSRILNTKGISKAKFIVYVSENDYKVLEQYKRYRSIKSLDSQSLTIDGMVRVQQAIVLIGYHKILERLNMTILQLVDIVSGYTSPANDIYALLNACGIGLHQEYLNNKLPESLPIDYRPTYTTKEERNKLILLMYMNGWGLRQLENSGFGIKKSAIRSILIKAGVYKGAEEGKIRHQLGYWRESNYPRFDSTTNMIDKITKSKHTSSTKQRKSLFELRRNSALTQQQISDLLGCSKAYYCNIENGRETPSEAFISKVAELFGLESDATSDIAKVSTIRHKQPVKKEVDTNDTNENETDCYDVYDSYKPNSNFVKSGYESPL